MSDFNLSPPILAAILCNAPPLVFQNPLPPPDNYCTVPKGVSVLRALLFQNRNFKSLPHNMMTPKAKRSKLNDIISQRMLEARSQIGYGFQRPGLGLKQGQELENRAAHPHQEFLGVFPRGRVTVVLRKWELLLSTIPFITIIIWEK